MAIVDMSSDAVRSGGGVAMVTPDPRAANAELRAAIGSVAHLASDNNGSRYRLFTVPSRAILRPETRIDLTGWGYAAATVGLAANRGGAQLTANGLLASVTISSLSGAFSQPIVICGSKWCKPPWQQAALSSDPGGLLDVIIATAADATGAGVARFDAVWQID